MKILQKISINGTCVQREDWKENYSFHAYGDTIAFYPITYGRTWLVNPRDRIRFEIQCVDTFQADIFMAMLESGEMSLKQLVDEAIKQNLFYNYTGKEPDMDGNYIKLEEIQF